MRTSPIPPESASIPAILTVRGSEGRTRTPIALCDSIFPKGTDLSRYNRCEVGAVADELNNRPRKKLE